MPAFNPFHYLAGRGFRAAAGFAGIFLLLLQLLSPALASSHQGTWIEICSEAGAVWVQVDAEEDIIDPTAPCPKCADCALCAVTGNAPLPGTPELARFEFVRFVRLDCLELYKPHNPARMWPETRGPPSAIQSETERAPRVPMASFQVTGGAPWL